MIKFRLLKRSSRIAGALLAALGVACVLGVISVSQVDAAPQSYDVQVPGNQQWTATGIQLQAGDQVTITASGTIQQFGDPSPYCSLGPAGLASFPAPSGFPLPGANAHSLIGRVGSGTAFSVGSSYGFSAASGGQLYLGVNYDFVYATDSGYWTAHVAVQQSTPPTTLPLTTTTTKPATGYAVQAQAGSHGSVSPASQNVTAGSSADVTITPDAGYKISSVTDNGVDATPQLVPLFGDGIPSGTYFYPLSNVRANHTIAATFVPLAGSYAVNASVSGGHGAVSPASQAVTAGDSANVTITPDSGYKIASVTDNNTDMTGRLVNIYGGGQTESRLYALNNVQMNHTIVATFASQSGGASNLSSPIRGNNWYSPAQLFGHWWDTKHGFHSAIDWISKSGAGSEVYAIGPGVVYGWDDRGDDGEMLIIEHDGSFIVPSWSGGFPGNTGSYGSHTEQKIFSVYMHIHTTLRPGMSVKDSSVTIGTLDNLSDVFGGPHLHFEIRSPVWLQYKFGGGSLVEPIDNLSDWNGSKGNGYYKLLQTMLNSGFLEPISVLEANGAVLPPYADTFSDVSASPYSGAILAIAADGIVNGFSDGTFRPNNPVLRQQFAKMIVLSLGIPVSQADICPFGDVDQGGSTDPLYPDHYVAVAAANGITNGVAPGVFGPYLNVTRAQVITMAVRAAQNFQPDLLREPPPAYQSSLPSSSPTHDANLRIAEYNGLLAGLVGYGPYWDPWAAMSRGEVAQILWRLWSPMTYAIGDTGPAGGLIFYDKGDDSGGWRYLEAASASTEGRGVTWGNFYGRVIPGANGTAVGTGGQNTAAIIAVQGTGSTTAAQLCAGLTFNGYSDWFLPSKDELALLYANLFGKGVGGFASADLYWSSTEDQSIPNSVGRGAWGQNFANGTQWHFAEGDPGFVRAVRAF